ncbi:TonB-dependent receptor domain-containing protein, partial [Bacteroides thetaiotaomicron]|uniref:TonB-dependent receptor domain-containing protein n=1 Tax=Bacteroides thetaiotaomicron TaxID=818 RepID=UPI003F747C49
MWFNMANMIIIYFNTDLKEETSNNFSVSAEYTKSRYNFSITRYYNLVHNRINTVYSEEPKGQIYTNNDKID